MLAVATNTGALMAPRVIIRILCTLAVCTCLPSAYAHDAAEEPGCEPDGADAEMGSVYEFVLNVSDGERKVLLDHAQRAWLDYRDATCQVFSERPGNRALAAAAFDDCLTFMARERTLELRILGRLSEDSAAAP